MLHRDTCYRQIHQRNFRDKRFPRKVCFDLGDVKVEKDIVTFNEEEDEGTLVEKDLKLNAARCTWDFSTETFVTSGSRVKRFLTWVMSKWRTSL